MPLFFFVCFVSTKSQGAYDLWNLKTALIKRWTKQEPLGTPSRLLMALNVDGEQIFIIRIHNWSVVSTHLKNISQQLDHFPGRDENKKYLKPPAR